MVKIERIAIEGDFLLRSIGAFLILLLCGVGEARPAGATSATTGPARVVTWRGGAGDARWSSAANWEGGIVPGPFDRVRFPAGAPGDARVDSSFPGAVGGLTIESGYAGTVTLARDLTVRGELAIAGGSLEQGTHAITARTFSQAGGTFTGGSAPLTIEGAAEVSGGTVSTPSAAMSVSTLAIQSPDIVRLGVGGKLNLTGDGTPLTGDGVLDTTTNAPNSVEYTGRATGDLTAAGPATAYHALAGMGRQTGAQPDRPPPSANETLPLAPATFTRTSSLVLTAGEDILLSAVIDSDHGFAYFGTYTSPGIVVKVRLSDFTRVGALTLNAGENSLTSAVIDTANGFAYFGTTTTCVDLCTTPDIVVKVQLSDFTEVSALTLNTGEGALTSAVIDADNGFAYFGTSLYAYAGIVVKVRLSDFTRVGALTLNPGDGCLSLHSAVIDTTNGFAYFGTSYSCKNPHPGPDMVVKVRLSDFTRVGALTLNPGENWLFSAVIDTANGFAYFGARSVNPYTLTYYSLVVKVRLSDFTRVGTLGLNTGEGSSAVIDTASGFAYFGTLTSPGVVVKVRLSDFTRVDALTLNLGENYLTSAVIDAANGFAYFGTYTSPGIVVKVNVGFADLVLTQSANLVSAHAGDSLTYTLGIANDSPITATGLTLTDTLPLSVTFVSVVPGASTCSLSGGQVICNLGTLAAGANTQVAIQVGVTGTGTGLLTNIASVSAAEPRFAAPKTAILNMLINPLRMFQPFVAR